MINPNKWYPFKDLEGGNQIEDFDLDDVAKLMDLSGVQCALLSYLLRDLDLQIWFRSADEKEITKKDSLSLTLFFGHNFVTEIDLIDMLEAAISARMEIGDEKEFAVLERLRDCITAEIALRQEEKKALPDSEEVSP